MTLASFDSTFTALKEGFVALQSAQPGVFVDYICHRFYPVCCTYKVGNQRAVWLLLVEGDLNSLG